MAHSVQESIKPPPHLQMLLSLSNIKNGGIIGAGADLGLVSAVFKAAYLVFLKRAVANENRLNIPMYFGKAPTDMAY